MKPSDKLRWANARASEPLASALTEAAVLLDECEREMRALRTAVVARSPHGFRTDRIDALLARLLGEQP